MFDLGPEEAAVAVTALARLREVWATAVGPWLESRAVVSQAEAKKRAKIIAAEGDVEAARIRALGSIEIAAEADELATRASERVDLWEQRRQKNLEDIAHKAVHQLPESVSDEKVDEDWIFQWFNSCQDVSDEVMQNLWARVLAGEVAQPGSYSKRALHTLRILGRDEAEIFKKLSSYFWFYGPRPVVVFKYKRVMEHLERQQHLYYGHLLTLESAGLLSFRSGLIREIKPTESVEYGCYGRTLRLANPSPSIVKLPIIALTRVGSELHQLCDPEPDEEYRKLLIEEWRDQGLEVQEVAKGKEAKAE